MIENDDDLMFTDDESDVEKVAESTLRGSWKIIIVDDEASIHKVTTLALDGFVFDDKDLEFLHAYTASEGRELILAHPDTAILLLDVVMENEHAGLDLAKFIREDAGNKLSRIILRTGQPGQAPEREVIQKYDINDYKEKTELTSQKLFTLMYASLRSYRDVIALEANKLGLERVIKSSADILALKSIRAFTEGVLSQMTSLLHLDSEAAYMKTDGLALSKDGEALKVMAATGEYGPLVGADANTALEKEILNDIGKAISTGQSYYRDDRFIGFFSSPHGSFNILYLTGLRPLNELDQSLMELFLKNIAIAYENIDLHQEVEETQREIVYMLGEAVETRSRETGNHVKRVAEISKILALAYGFDEETAEIVRLASPLHDVGKIGIPDAILNKPGKHTPEEWEIMKSHAMLGYDMLKSSNRRILKASAVIARDHHERWVGGGYPYNKSGEDIHIYGRITAIADVFDALGNDRCYKKAWPLERIMALMQEERGQQFEPQLVDMVIANMDKIEQICVQFKEGKPVL
ncbi:hypothetical protein A9Q83_07295 [Alphaproteobacteria bacterium 46_93_T64]|nr:hypothetical protein A9Q83_07295 [Alphaproteobacteria bacterium 46_93_T64]